MASSSAPRAMRAETSCVSGSSMFRGAPVRPQFPALSCGRCCFVPPGSWACPHCRPPGPMISWPRPWPHRHPPWPSRMLSAYSSPSSRGCAQAAAHRREGRAPWRRCGGSLGACRQRLPLWPVQCESTKALDPASSQCRGAPGASTLWRSAGRLLPRRRGRPRTACTLQRRRRNCVPLELPWRAPMQRCVPLWGLPRAFMSALC
mmetsp:Transcript_21203/g.46184  ORF Transcript_21203/g.46184 Transcript_21203/m.46184 type:complete len:204 (+) Transcript_21203:182-793(+)